MFAAALGIAAGAVLRRTLPAIAIVIGGFLGMRLWISQGLRMHFMMPVTTYYSVTGNFNPPAGSAVLNGGLVDQAGHLVTGSSSSVMTVMIDGLPSTALPAACQRLIPASANGPGGPSNATVNAVLGCLQKAGWRQFTAYQPISRYWAFQGIEAGIFVALAAVLVAVAFAVVTRRDA